jgi:hypothetical protein
MIEPRFITRRAERFSSTVDAGGLSFLDCTMSEANLAFLSGEARLTCGVGSAAGSPTIERIHLRVARWNEKWRRRWRQ